METLGLLDLRVVRVLLVFLGLLAKKESLEEMENRGLQDLPDHLGKGALLGCQEYLDPKATGDFQVWMGPRETSVTLEPRERMGPQGPLELLGPLVPWVPEGREEGMDHQDPQGFVGSMEPWDLQENLDP